MRVTVDKACGSGLTTVRYEADDIRRGEAAAMIVERRA